MAWHKNQLMEKLKTQESNKTTADKANSKKPTGKAFDPSKIKSTKHAFKNPVAEMNRNRKKTDLPSA